MSSEILNLEAEEQKELGNESFRKGDFAKAVEYFTNAIQMDDKNFKYFTNRSLCFASLNQWGKSCHDAKTAVSLSSNYEKAHFRLVKALIEMSHFKEARVCLLLALKECGETKDLKALESLIFVRTHIALRPKSTDFEIVDELGDGNFSKVYKACHKVTKKHYAIKVCWYSNGLFLS
jgi:tetratricopeptide (TPR) repeat protein